jgi:putative membrane protein
MWHSVDGMGWWMALGSVWMVFFWGLVIWALLRFIPHSPERSETALETLKGRYARGELTRDQYQEMRRDLET